MAEIEAEIEKEREPRLIEVSEKELLECGWKIYPRTDGHVFTILIQQNKDIQTALLTNVGLFARHQMKPITGRGLLPDQHIDRLHNQNVGDLETKGTSYNPSIGHHSYTVLIKASSQLP